MRRQYDVARGSVITRLDEPALVGDDDELGAVPG
jgi:hypothetical protein